MQHNTTPWVVVLFNWIILFPLYTAASYTTTYNSIYFCYPLSTLVRIFVILVSGQ